MVILYLYGFVLAQLDISGEWIWGRGSGDDKSGLVGIMCVR